MRFAALALLVSAITAPAFAQSGVWQTEPSGTTADLRGIHAVGGGIVWASGTQGVVLRSEDSGFEWQSCAMPPGAEKLDFRAIWAWDDENAMVMSAGPGEQSRLYRTTDGCVHWTLQATNHDKDGFWDGLVFSDRKNGYLVGDPVGGHLYLLRTQDGGAHWVRIEATSLDTKGRGLFAASNSSLALAGGVLGTPHGTVHVPWIGTGGPGGALVLNGGIDCGMEQAHRDPDSCLSHWDFQQQTVPLAGSTNSAGVFSLAMQTTENGPLAHAVAVGGDYTQFDQQTGTAAWWDSKTTHWTAATTPPGGYRSAVGWSSDLHAWVTVGPNGSDQSRDGGRTWQPLERATTQPAGTVPKGGEWNALSLPWAVGPHGRIAKLNPDAVSVAPAKQSQSKRKSP